MSSSNYYKHTTSTTERRSSDSGANASGAGQICAALMFLIGIGAATLLILKGKEWWSVMILVASLIFCSFMGAEDESEDKEKQEEPEDEM